MKKTRAKLWRVLSGISVALLALLVGCTWIGTTYSTWLDGQLGTTSLTLASDSDEKTYYYESSYSSLEEMLEDKEALLAEISAEGSVLLKNESSALPISSTAKVTLLGYGSYDPVYGGTIGSTTTEGGTATITTLQAALEEVGIEVNPTMVDFYANNPATRFHASYMFGTKYDSLMDALIGEVSTSVMVSAGVADDETTLSDAAIGEYSDAAIVVITRASSEAAEYNINSVTTDDGDSYDSPLDLSTYEKQVIDLAVNSFDTVIVLINSDSAMGIDYLKQTDGVDAVLWVGLPGAYGFEGVADVLTGESNPSGHLVDTYAVHPASAPANANMGLYTWANASTNGGSEMTSSDYGKSDWYVVENEGIYVGYKYYETRYADAVAGDAEALNNANATEYVKTYSDYDATANWDYNDQVSYSFGYGLSYTTFTQTLDSLTIDAASGTGAAVVTVTNTGDVAGKSTVQLYVQCPYTRGGTEKSAVQLVDFGKTDTLEPGASATVELTFTLETFASYNTDAEQWELDDGEYYFAVGNGAHEALNSILLSQGVSEDELSISTDSENATVEAVQAVELGDVSAYLAIVNENVENRFEQADYTTYDDSFQYISRADWSQGWETVGTEDGTGEDAVSYTSEMEYGLFAQLYTITANDKTDDMTFDWDVDTGLTIMDFIGVGLDETITKDGVTYTYDDLVNTMSLYEACYTLENEYQNLDAINSIELGEVVTNDGPAGFAYDQVPGYAYNWQSYESDEPTYVSADDENAETSMSVYNTEPVVASTWNKELVYAEGEMMGEDSLWADENLIIGPGSNLHRSAYNSRNHEYYSEDSVLTGLMTAALCEGCYTRGLMTQVKHFAFNHQEVNRAGTATFFNEQAGRENELRCFQYAFENNLTQSVMTAFNRVGVEYAGACEGLLIGVLRDEWGFEGSVVTDMVNGAMYMNWLDSFACGLSGTLGTNAYEATSLGASTSAANQALIVTDAYLQQQIHDAIKYTVYQVANSNYMNGMDSTSRWETVTQWWKAALYGGIALFAVLTLAFLALYLLALTKERSGTEKKRTLGFWLLAVSTVLMIVAAVLYPNTAFSADYAPLQSVETILIATAVLGAVTMGATFVTSSKYLDVLPVVLSGLSMLGLAFSFYPMITPIAYVISGLNTYAEISAWVNAAIVMGAGVLCCIVSLFCKLTTRKDAAVS
ncbi:MAG: glycoside hydrolase family 3 C-terminal domain-containing protein [Clostridiales bacterium]|nr:glycoside hydrolase family 3 C-terminal domain-containing protein [Clostridiales bacterium]